MSIDITEDTKVMVTEASSTVPGLPEIEGFKKHIQQLALVHQAINAMFVENVDYGVIPGTGKKNTLLLPGAQKITKLFKVVPDYDILEKIEDFDKPRFHYLVKTTLSDINTRQVVDRGVGSCNSEEDKYQYRWVIKSKVPPLVNIDRLESRTSKSQKYGSTTYYKTVNQDISSLANTILKIAKKRSLVDSSISIARCSNLFDQDFDDLGSTIITQIPEEIPKGEGAKSAGPKNTDDPETYLKVAYFKERLGELKSGSEAKHMLITTWKKEIHKYIDETMPEVQTDQDRLAVLCTWAGIEKAKDANEILGVPAYLAKLNAMAYKDINRILFK